MERGTSMRVIVAVVIFAGLPAFGGERAAPAREDAKPTAAELKRYRELCYTMGSDALNIRWGAAFQLMEAGPKAIGPLAEILKGDWVEGRRMVAYMLGEMKHPAAIGPLANTLGDADFHVRWKAAVALKAIGKPSTEALIAVLGGGNIEARRCAAWALGEIKAADAAPARCRVLGDPDHELAAKARVSLSTLGTEAIDALARELDSENVRVRYWAAEVLGELGSPLALGPLARAAKDKDPGVRRIAATSLGMIGEPKAQPALETLIKDGDATARRNAIISLARYGITAESARTPAVGEGAIPKVERWKLHEIELPLQEPPANANPFTSITVGCDFVSPSKAAVHVPGFYAGAGKWKVRIAPSEAGEWSYTISIISGEAVRTRHGVVECIESKRPGPPAAHAERPGCFAGLVPIEVGTTSLWRPAANGSPRNTPEAWKKLFAAMARSKVNKLRLKLIEPCNPAVIKAHPELSPWQIRPDGKFDLTRFELRYWDALDAVLDEAAEAGVTIELAAFDEDDLRRPNWGRHPFNAVNGGPIDAEEATPIFYDLTLVANEAAQKLYLSYLAARAAGRGNVAIDLSNRLNYDRAAVPFGRRWAKQHAKLIHANAPPWLLVSLSPASGAAPYFRLAGIDVANVPPSFAGGKIDKPCVQIAAPGNAAAIRRAAWSSAVRGRGISFRPECSTADALRARTEMLAPLAKFLRQLPPEHFKPDDSAVLSMPNGVTAFAARSGSHIWVYFAGESLGEAEIELGAKPGAYRARWFSPEGGVFDEAVEGEQQKGSVKLKCPPFAHDAALLLMH